MKILTLILLICCTFSSVTAQSDEKAIAIAQEVIEDMGGQEAWDQTRYLQWNFFGSRMWWWDKWTGNVRMESQRSDLRIAMNVHDKTGNVFIHGTEQTAPDSLSKYLDMGYKMWINDSYWLVMPFKLLDPGTSLKYIGTGNSTSGKPGDVLELTFDQVGVTPQNKYHIYVATNNASTDNPRHVIQWDYYRNATDQTPAFQSEWNTYSRFGKIQLSTGRGDRSLDNVDAPTSLPPFLFINVLKPASELIR